MRSDNRWIEDAVDTPVDPTKVAIGNFRTATDGCSDEVVKRRTAQGSTVRAMSAFANPVEAATGADLSAVASGTALVKDANGKFIVAGANAATVYFLEHVFNRGVTQYARAVPGDAASLIVARAPAALAANLPLATDAAGKLVAAAPGENVVAVSEMAVLVAGPIVVTTQKWKA